MSMFGTAVLRRFSRTHPAAPNTCSLFCYRYWMLQRQVTTRSLRSTDAPRHSVPWTRSVWRLRTSGTHYRMTSVRC